METEQSASPAPTPVGAGGVGTPSSTEGAKENNDKGEPNIAELQRLIEETRAKVDANSNELLRVRAEMENVRRRAERDVESAHKFALERFVTELLPIRDSLELGLSAATEGVASDAAKLREGIDLTLKMLATAMARFGVREVNPVNERFNPEWHQAMTVQPSSVVPHNTVLMVYQKGYVLNERLIRPALVIVSQIVPPEETKEGGEVQKGGPA